MKYSDWLATVPPTITTDPLWKMQLYRQALFAGELAWHDCDILRKQAASRAIADQLIRSAGSVSANIAEGYSRSGGKDRARFYEFAMGSARETRDWYYKAKHILNPDVIEHRMQLQSEIVRQLLNIIPKERKRNLQNQK